MYHRSGWTVFSVSLCPATLPFHPVRRPDASRILQGKTYVTAVRLKTLILSTASSPSILIYCRCVAVLLDVRRNKQSHVINSCKKSITSLAFSADGKHLITGEVSTAAPYSLRSHNNAGCDLFTLTHIVRTSALCEDLGCKDMHATCGIRRP